MGPTRTRDWAFAEKEEKRAIYTGGAGHCDCAETTTSRSFAPQPSDSSKTFFFTIKKKEQIGKSRKKEK